MAEAVVDLLAGRHAVFARLGALGDDHDRCIPAALVPAVQQLADLLDVERLFRDQDGGGAAGDPCVRGDPSRMAPHHLDDHHPVVALGGRMQAVDGIGGNLHRRREPECHVGADDVVVDRLRHPDDREVEIMEELARNREGTIPADDDETVDPHVAKRRGDLFGPVRVVIGTAPPGAQQGATLREHSAK